MSAATAAATIADPWSTDYAAPRPCRCTGRLSETCAYHRSLAQPPSYREYVLLMERIGPQDESWMTQLLAADR